MNPRTFLKLIIIISVVTSPWVVFAQSRLESTNLAIIDSQVGSVSGVSESTNYGLINSINPLADSRLTSNNYALGSGFPSGIQANIPAIRCFETDTDDSVSLPYTNTDCTDPVMTAATGGDDDQVGNGLIGACGDPGCIDRAKIEIDDQGNPFDTLYLVEVSNDNFVSSLLYLQADKSLTASYSYSNFMTICQLQGYDSRDSDCNNTGDSGWNLDKQQTNIVGLTYNSTWYVRVKAISGDFTETQYSEVESASTVTASATMDIDIDTGYNDCSEENSGPYIVDLGTLGPSAATVLDRYICLEVSTNATDETNIYVNDQYGGLYSSENSYTIASETEDLTIDDGDGGFGIGAGTSAMTNLLNIDPGYSYTFEEVGEVFTTPTLFLNATPGNINEGVAYITVAARAGLTTPGGSYRNRLTFTMIPAW